MNGESPVDNVLKRCPKCKRVFEVVRGNAHYYEDFPRIGKKKVICPNCSGTKGQEKRAEEVKDAQKTIIKAYEEVITEKIRKGRKLSRATIKRYQELKK